MIETVIKFHVRGQSLWGNVPCIYLAKVPVLHFCIRVLQGWQLSGNRVQGVLGPPGRAGSQDLSHHSPEPGSWGTGTALVLGTGTGQAGLMAGQCTGVGGWKPVLLWHHWVGGWWPVGWNEVWGCAKQEHWYLQGPDESVFVVGPLGKYLERALNASGDCQHSLTTLHFAFLHIMWRTYTCLLKTTHITLWMW